MVKVSPGHPKGGAGGEGAKGGKKNRRKGRGEKKNTFRLQDKVGDHPTKSIRLAGRRYGRSMGGGGKGRNKILPEETNHEEKKTDPRLIEQSGEEKKQRYNGGGVPGARRDGVAGHAQENFHSPKLPLKGGE